MLLSRRPTMDRILALCIFLCSGWCLAGPARLVILGDSITAGYGLDKDQAYPAQLAVKLKQERLDVEVVNAGVSGDTTAGGSRRVLWALGKDGADALLIALGGNDGLRGLAPAQTRANLLAIIRQARERRPDIHIVLAGMKMPDNMGTDFQQEYAATFPAVAADAGVTLLPFLLKDVAGVDSLNQEDRIHPNAKGQKIVMETVRAALQPWLAKLKAAKPGPE